MAPKRNDDWQCCYYDIQGSITNGKETVQLRPSQVTGLMIERDYDTDHLPVILISLSLQDEIDVDNNSSIHLRIDKIIGEEDKGVITVNSKSSYINGIFSFVILDDTPDSSYFDNIINAKQEKTEGDYLMQDARSSQTYILVQKDLLASSKKILNCVLKKSTMTAATAMLLSNAGCSNVLMSNFDNVEEYDELIIPPLPLLESINYLKNYYGFHKEDTTIFMDLDATYIVRKDGVCTAYRNRETTNVDICLNGYESQYDQCRGVIYNGNTTYINVGSDQFKRLVGGTLTDQTEGTDVLLYNESETSSNIVSTENDRALNGKNTSVKSVAGHNKFVQTQIECRKTENQYVFTLGCSNADVSVFTPNKQFSIISNCAEIAIDVTGKYRLSKHVTTFAKTGKYFVPISNLTLKKTKVG